MQNFQTFLAVVAAFVVLYIFLQRRKKRRNKKILLESFKNPTILNIKNNAGKIYKVIKLSPGRVQLSEMELITARDGNSEIQELLTMSYVDLWFQKEGIPRNFLAQGFIFETKNEDGELKFFTYNGIKKKINRNSFSTETEKVTELIETE